MTYLKFSSSAVRTVVDSVNASPCTELSPENPVTVLCFTLFFIPKYSRAAFVLSFQVLTLQLFLDQEIPTTLPLPKMVSVTTLHRSRALFICVQVLASAIRDKLKRAYSLYCVRYKRYLHIQPCFHRNCRLKIGVP